MSILVLDNYDSFTYNLVHLIEAHTHLQVDVFRNDEIALEAVDRYEQIILSPGPGVPKDAGILCPLIKRYKSTKAILGVCLGMQAIAEVYGGSLVNMQVPMHGIARSVQHTGVPLFAGIPAIFQAGRYHSWAVDKATLPVGLHITATDNNGWIMALEHSTDKVFGVQFHPESIMTEYGKDLLLNFLACTAV